MCFPVPCSRRGESIPKAHDAQDQAGNPFTWVFRAWGLGQVLHCWAPGACNRVSNFACRSPSSKGAKQVQAGRLLVSGIAQEGIDNPVFPEKSET